MHSDIPLINTVDLEIIMHRDVHFGGSFDMMLSYYKKGGVGVMPDFPVARIKSLATYEKTTGTNLSETLLPTPEQEKVEEAKKLYFDLRSVYESPSPEPQAILISDLILAEDEEAKEEVDAIVKKGAAMVPALIHMLAASPFYDPLYPGYGRVPLLAAKALARIGDERALQPLFEALGQDNFYADEEIIKALRSFGIVSRDFLLKILCHKPYSKDNEHAAIALGSFPEDPIIASACLHLLKEGSPPFAAYLVFGCAALSSPEEKALFRSFSEDQRFSKDLRDEIKLICKTWK